MNMCMDVCNVQVWMFRRARSNSFNGPVMLQGLGVPLSD